MKFLTNERPRGTAAHHLDKQEAILHVRAASAQVRRGKVQELIDIYNNPIVPSFKRLKGFKSAYLMIDVGSHTALSVTV